ncbi:MAG: ISKra4 family transposase [Gemmataceae bacterium]
MTALGAVRLRRCYACCPACEQGSFPADGLLGLDGWLTPRALQMACRAGIADPFRKAESLLEELAGWSVAADTLRRRCHEQAAKAAANREGRAALPEAFAQAPGDFELHVDAGKVNTLEDGWRDVKVAVFARRDQGEPCDSAGLAERTLPGPSARAVVAAVEGRGDFGLRVEAEALRLGVPLGAGLSVLGDGAGWIWGLADDHFHGAAGVLDFWHAAEKLAKAGRAALGEGEGFRGWLEGAKGELAADGYPGACETLGALAARPGLTEAAGEAVAEAWNYFAGHRDRLGYAPRLYRGQAIGSGLVEGSIKQLVNLRMKRTGARWRVALVGPFVEFVALADGPEWHEHWEALAA